MPIFDVCNIVFVRPLGKSFGLITFCDNECRVMFKIEGFQKSLELRNRNR